MVPIQGVFWKSYEPELVKACGMKNMGISRWRRVAMHAKTPLVSLFILLCLPLAATAEETEPAAGRGLDRTTVDWIRTDKVRAVYSKNYHSSQLPAKIADAGFNTLHVQFVRGTYLNREEFLKWGKLCRDNRLRYFASIWWSQAAWDQQRYDRPSGIGTTYRAFVSSKGKVHERTVCPADASYWKQYFHPALLAMAGLATEAQLTGLTIDTELYQSDADTGCYYFNGPCLCDGCFGDYLKLRRADQKAGDVAVGQRYRGLQDGGHVNDYQAHLKSRVEALARQLEQKIHERDPHLLLGFLLYYGQGDYFLNGLRDGFKTAERPVVIWPEGPTYSKGYTGHVDDQYAMFQRVGDVVYVPGLWLEAHAPLTLPEQQHNLASHSDGYWYYWQNEDLLLLPYILKQMNAGNEKIATRAPTAAEAPFIDLWETYTPVLTLPATAKFSTDPKEVGQDQQWYASEFDDGAWQTIPVGEFWDKALNTQYTGVGWYRLRFEAPAQAAEKKLFLAFGAVDEEAWVYLNGKLVGQHTRASTGKEILELWNERFLVDVTETMKPGQVNFLTVRVLNGRMAGGIWKPIRLIAAK